MLIPADMSAPEQFEAALRRGLGRAVLFLNEHDPAPYRDIILDACAHNWAYDPQCEDHRALYMFDVIRATGEVEFYAERIREFLRSPEEDYNVRQVLDLNVLLAKSGDTLSRRAVYEAYARDAKKWYTTDSRPLVEMDGIDGYLFAVSQLLRYRDDDNPSDEIRLLDEAEEQCGSRKLSQAVRRASQSDPRIGEYVDHIRRLRAKRNARRRKQSKTHTLTATYDDIQHWIHAPELKRYRLIRNGRFADDQAVVRVAHEFIAESDPDTLLRYLHVFAERAFPFDHSRVLSLATDDDERLALAARRALRHICHPTVRALALDLAASGDRPWDAVHLLRSNYQDGDYALIAEIVAREHDADTWEMLGIAIRELFERHPDPATLPILMTLYEQGYCTICRGGVIDCLLDLGPLPGWMIEECRFDADVETRKTNAELDREGRE